MRKRALVLGGGGTLGIAWETGVLVGLHRAGVDVSDADLVVGTSAGSVVGTQLTLGMPLEAMLAAQLAPPAEDDAPPTIDPRSFGAVVQLLGQTSEATPALLADIGRLALSAATGDEAAYLQRFALLAGQPWPVRDLRITAVDTKNGTFHAWSRDEGVPLDRAVAASCAVPGIFPPVTMSGQRYMDGGMRSDTNADLVVGYGRVLIIAPIGSQGGGAGLAAQRPVLREVELLRASGAQVELLAPDTATLQVFGINLMESSRRGRAAEEGLRQGQAVAASIRPLWVV
jgi:NTE family protein